MLDFCSRSATGRLLTLFPLCESERPIMSSPLTEPQMAARRKRKRIAGLALIVFVLMRERYQGGTNHEYDGVESADLIAALRVCSSYTDQISCLPFGWKKFVSARRMVRPRATARVACYAVHRYEISGDGSFADLLTSVVVAGLIFGRPGGFSFFFLG
jgi:hypothetical protein